MDKNQNSYLKMGIVHFMAFPELASGRGPWEETVKHIATDPFFSAIEITHIEDEAQRRGATYIVAQLDIGFEPIRHFEPGTDLNSLDESRRCQQLPSSKSCWMRPVSWALRVLWFCGRTLAR
jgi:hypothetical protein